MKYMEQELISIPVDNSKVNALFYKSVDENTSGEKEPLIIHVHGFLGNFLDGSQRFLPPILARAGYSSVAINTRMANFGLLFGYGLIEDVIKQIDGVIKYFESQGYKKILISGYSLGGSIVLRYTSLRNKMEEYKSLQGVISLSYSVLNARFYKKTLGQVE